MDKEECLSLKQLFIWILQEVSTQEQRLYSIAAKYGYGYLYNSITIIIFNRGIPGGEENGKKGYMLTFVIAYIRVS